jgi:hypothetical protein
MQKRAEQINCALCGATLFGVSPTSKVVKVIIGVPGGDNLRALMVEGREVHRCPALGPPTSSRVDV